MIHKKYIVQFSFLIDWHACYCDVCGREGGSAVSVNWNKLEERSTQFAAEGFMLPALHENQGLSLDIDENRDLS